MSDINLKALAAAVKVVGDIRAERPALRPLNVELHDAIEAYLDALPTISVSETNSEFADRLLDEMRITPLQSSVNAQSKDNTE